MGTTQVTFDDVDQNITEDIQTVEVALGDVAVSVDLGPGNRTKLTEFLTPFLKAGRATVATAAPVEQAPAVSKPRAARKTAAAKPAASKTTPAKTSVPKPTGNRAAMAEENERIRAWASQNEIELNPKGRIPNEVKEQYYQTNPVSLVG